MTKYRKYTELIKNPMPRDQWSTVSGGYFEFTDEAIIDLSVLPPNLTHLTISGGRTESNIFDDVDVSKYIDLEMLFRGDDGMARNVQSVKDGYFDIRGNFDKLARLTISGSVFMPRLISALTNLRSISTTNVATCDFGDLVTASLDYISCTNCYSLTLPKNKSSLTGIYVDSDNLDEMVIPDGLSSLEELHLEYIGKVIVDAVPPRLSDLLLNGCGLDELSLSELITPNVSDIYISHRANEGTMVIPVHTALTTLRLDISGNVEVILDGDLDLVEEFDVILNDGAHIGDIALGRVASFNLQHNGGDTSRSFNVDLSNAHKVCSKVSISSQSIAKVTLPKTCCAATFRIAVSDDCEVILPNDVSNIEHLSIVGGNATTRTMRGCAMLANLRVSSDRLKKLNISGTTDKLKNITVSKGVELSCDMERKEVIHTY